MKDYKKILEGVVSIIDTTEKSDIGFANICTYIGENCPELKESEQNILFEELKALHLKMEYQTVCNDAGGNRMWRRAWQHVNEAINIIKEDKEAFKW
jgi:hypothetical protein